MRMTCKNFKLKFKTQVAIEAFNERENLTELAKYFELQANQISTWKRELLEP